ncbi:MAG: AAA domain-containing protein [Myxococcales bacterium]|nr:AAA domain-containing protein [Myxococcales bacterium]
MGDELSRQVLRYWLGCVRMEEALATRPRARKLPPGRGRLTIDLVQPVEGLEYLRLACDEGTWRLATEQGRLDLPMDHAGAAFFETWLYRKYRSGSGGKGRAAQEADDEDRLEHMLAFPVVHLPRQELAGLLRCDVGVEFLQPDGSAFEVPDARARRSKNLPPAPVQLRISGPRPVEERRLPLFIDTRLLHDQLGVEAPELEAFFRGLDARADASGRVAPRVLLTALCELLAPDTEDGQVAASDAQTLTAASPSELLTLLAQRMNARMAVRQLPARAYGVAIVVDAQQVRATWHLQRELELLIGEYGRREDTPAAATRLTPLEAYLSGRAPAPAAALHRAAFEHSSLTQGQREAAERFLGSTLCAVQGPPGTGKTTLILHLAAEHMLEQLDALVDKGEMGDRLLLVASTNNRAVDNVIEPLDRDPDGLPLALRCGSRQVCHKVTAAQLRKALTWLARARPRDQAARAQATENYEQAVRGYRRARQQLLQREGPRAKAMKAQRAAAAARAKLDHFDAQLRERQVDPETPLPVEKKADLASLTSLLVDLDRLEDMAGRNPSKSAQRRLDKAYRRVQTEYGATLETVRARASEAAPWPLPPAGGDRDQPGAYMEAWEEAIETAIDQVEALRTEVGERLELRELLKERRRLQHVVEARRAVPEVAPPSGALDPLRGELLQSGLALRERWATLHAEQLSQALAVALECVQSERSMRTLFRAETEAGRWLRQLCGVWGSTLLSMANAVVAESRHVERVVIDEAGQCHPAHAISALVRARSALIIGDVNQLEPVVELTASDERRVRLQAGLRLSDAVLAPYRVGSENSNSVQSLADRACGGPLRLTDHFRCQPSIIAICDAICNYGLKVHTPPSSRERQAPFLHSPVLFVDVDGRQERLGGSWTNPAELELCMQWLLAILDAGIAADDIAIITPYRGQLEQLQRAVARRGIRIARGLAFDPVADEQGSLFGAESEQAGVTLGTVHRFQGGERSVVIFSSVVTDPRSLGFLNDRVNLLNVTVSRAREHLITLGHRQTLGTGRYTRRLLGAPGALSLTQTGCAGAR